ncbi:MAG: AAA family ATPase [Proteobacteria bacterium]|nr:AAA family ATPase [Pseudomonadota bacterium]
MRKVASWKYKTRNGVQIGVVNRFESGDDLKPSKQIIPCFKSGSQGQFALGIPESINNNRPLYGLDGLRDGSQTVYIVEGEKCAKALNSAFGYACITSLGGSNNADKADWSELTEFNDFVLLPDNDKCGMSYMQTVYNCIKKLNPKAKFSLVELENLPEKGDFCDWVQNNINIEWDEFAPLNKVLSEYELIELKQKFDRQGENLRGKIPPIWNMKTGSKGLKTISLSDFVRLNIPKAKDLLSPWLTEQSLTMVYADRGVGKTFFSLNCAYALASGRSFLKYGTKEKVSVIYLDGEMQAPLMIERLNSISGGKVDGVPIHIVTPDLQGDRCVPDLSSIEGQQEFDEMIEKLGAKVIFVDNLSTLCRTGRENEGESWTDIQSWAIRHRSQGRSIVFVHHANKGGGQRGSSRKEDVLDNVIHLKRPEDYDESKDGAKFEVHFEKNRSIFGKDTATIIASLDNQGEWSWSYVEGKEEAFLNMYDSGMTQAEIAKEKGVSKSCVCKMIAKAKKQKQLMETPEA